MVAPLTNTNFVGRGTRSAKMPMASPKTGGLHDIYSKGKQAYGIASSIYGAYQTGSQIYRVVRPFLQARVPL